MLLLDEPSAPESKEQILQGGFVDVQVHQALAQRSQRRQYGHLGWAGATDGGLTRRHVHADARNVFQMVLQFGP